MNADISNRIAAKGFFDTVATAVAQSIARDFLAGDTKAASDRLEQHLSALDDSAAANFISIVQQYIEGTR